MLDEALILTCDWSVAGGTLAYDISHLEADWSRVVQAYEIRSITYDGKFVYNSEFQLFKTGSDIPANFSAYPTAAKRRLWQVIFAIKQRFLDEVRPDVVEHFIKAPYGAAARLALYQRHLNLSDYDVMLTPQTFTFIRRDLR